MPAPGVTNLLGWQRFAAARLRYAVWRGVCELGNPAEHMAGAAGKACAPQPSHRTLCGRPWPGVPVRLDTSGTSGHWTASGRTAGAPFTGQSQTF